MNREEKLAQLRKQKFFVWRDIFVFAIAILLIVVGTWVAFLPKHEVGDSFSVYYQGEKIFSASLQMDAKYVFWIDEKGGRVDLYQVDRVYNGYNLILVQNGHVRVLEADCPDHTCVLQGERDWGEILCLPHELRITIDGSELETDI